MFSGVTRRLLSDTKRSRSFWIAALPTHGVFQQRPLSASITESSVNKASAPPHRPSRHRCAKTDFDDHGVEVMAKLISKEVHHGHVEPFGDARQAGGDRGFHRDAAMDAHSTTKQCRKVPKVESRTKLDSVAGAHWLKQVIDVDTPAKVFIDLGGVGAGTYDILMSWGSPYDKIVVGVNFGGAPREPIEYLKDGTKQPGPKNRRAEIWKASKEWLCQEAGVDIPDIDSLQADACAPGYHYDMDQRLVLESKEHMRQRGTRSPDEWDAIALTFAEPVKVQKAQRAASEPVRRMSAEPATWMSN